MKLNINIYLTTSKFAAYAIIIIGSLFGFICKDGTTLIASFAAASALLITKTLATSKTEQTQIIEQNNNTK